MISCGTVYKGIWILGFGSQHFMMDLALISNIVYTVLKVAICLGS